MPELRMPGPPSPRQPTRSKKDTPPGKDVTSQYSGVLSGASTPAGGQQSSKSTPSSGPLPTPSNTPASAPQPALKPVPPPPALHLNALINGTDAMAGAVNNTYLGNFTEADAKGHVARTVQVTQWQDMMMAEIVQDSRFGYSGSKAQFMRHAIELLLAYLQEKGMVKEERRGLFGDLLRAGRMLREEAERERIRNDFTDDIRAHDRSMDTARMTGDWAHIGRQLQLYMDAIESCEDESQRKILRGVFAESVATRTAVTAFNRWIDDPDRAPNDRVVGWQDSWPTLAEQWWAFYQEWGNGAS